VNSSPIGARPIDGRLPPRAHAGPGEQDRADDDRAVGEVEHGPGADVDEVDHVPTEPRTAQGTVRKVAERAAQHQAERHRGEHPLVTRRRRDDHRRYEHGGRDEDERRAPADAEGAAWVGREREPHTRQQLDGGPALERVLGPQFREPVEAEDGGGGAEQPGRAADAARHGATGGTAPGRP
jgi:hypothetical protein